MAEREISRRSACLLPFVLFGAGARTLRVKLSPLFVIARSKNANVLHYELRLDPQGDLRLKDPLVAYWVMHAEDGHKEGLTWPEREFAYGWRFSSRISPEGFRFRLQAFDGRELVVRRDQARRYRTFVRIQDKEAVLERIFVMSDDRGLTPTVRYVDVIGHDVETKLPVRERVRR